MIYTVDAAADEPIMLINQHIGMDEEDGMGVDGALFQNELLQLDNMGKKRIQVWINSPGGVILDGYNICSAILKSKTPVDTYNVGICASIAGAIFLMGRKRYMADYALFMMHPPTGGDNGKQFSAFMGSITKMLSAKSNIAEEKVKYLVERTTWMDSSDCHNMGFCTDIEKTNMQNQKWMPATVSETKAMWKERCEMVNNLFSKEKNTSLITKNNIMAYTKLFNKMGLVSEAQEESAVEAWDKMTNRAFDAEKEVTAEKERAHQEILKAQNKAKLDVDTARNETTAVKNELTVVKGELTTAKDALTAKETELAALKTAKDALQLEKDTAVAAEKKNKATTMVNGYVTSGRIKADSTDAGKKAVEKWVNMAIADYEGTEEIIKSIPLNKEAPKINTGNDFIPTGADVDPNKVPANAMNLAAKNKLRREGKAELADRIPSA